MREATKQTSIGAITDLRFSKKIHKIPQLQIPKQTNRASEMKNPKKNRK